MSNTLIWGSWLDGETWRVMGLRLVREAVVLLGWDMDKVVVRRVLEGVLWIKEVVAIIQHI